MVERFKQLRLPNCKQRPIYNFINGFYYTIESEKCNKGLIWSIWITNKLEYIYSVWDAIDLSTV